MISDLSRIAMQEAWPVEMPPQGRPEISHFGQRARERGVRSLSGDLLKDLVQYAYCHGREDVLERVFRLHNGRPLYRFRLPCGVFYAVIADGRAATFFNQDMKREASRLRKLRRLNRTPPD